jgi:NAD(P)H-dependent FMN reductase
MADNTCENNETGERQSHSRNDVIPSLRISAVCGSLRAEGNTKKALLLALKGASEYAVNTGLIELRDYKLVFCGECDEEDYPPDVFRLRKELKESQGIILGTPEYYASLSGAMKNMLDLTGSEVFEGKIVGLVGVAGGNTGAINSLNAMRIIGRNLHCWVLPQEVSVAESAKVFDEGGSVTDPAIEQRLLNIGRQVVKFTTLQQQIRQTDFIKLWEGLPRW